MTALHLAAKNGHLKTCEILLANGANVDAKNSRDHTPLWMAVDRGHVHVVERLLEYGADVNISQAHRLNAPILIAAERGYLDIIKLIVEKAKPNRESQEAAVEVATKKGQDVIVEYLIQENIQID